MRISRLLVVTALVLALVGLTTWWDGTPEPASEPEQIVDLPGAGSADGLSSTWYCAAFATGVEGTLHDLVVTNPGPATRARVTAYDAEGTKGVQSVDLAAGTTTKVETRELFQSGDVSVMVESPAGDLVVEHRLVTTLGIDQVACATSASDEWHFPALSTALGSASRLVLFNPFSSDAGVDVTVARDDGVSLPAALTGIVVPAGSSKVVDLSEDVVRRDLFALSLELRTGRVIAETVQVYDPAPIEALPPELRESATPARGVRMMLGVPRPASNWAFADGFTGPGVRERVVVYNPGADKVTVMIQVVPFSGAELAPEPFELEVAARRYGSVDLSAEGRIPAEGLHAIRVQAEPSDRVVVGRSVLIDGGPGDATTPGVVQRPDLRWGATISGGSPIAATGWLASGMVVDEGQQPMLQVHNPNPGIVSFTATILGGPDDGLVLADGVEVAAGDSLALPVAAEGLTAGEVTVVVDAGSPVVVERLITWVSRQDLSMGLAVPFAGEGERTVSLADQG